MNILTNLFGKLFFIEKSLFFSLGGFSDNILSVYYCPIESLLQLFLFVFFLYSQNVALIFYYIFQLFFFLFIQTGKKVFVSPSFFIDVKKRFHKQTVNDEKQLLILK